MVRTQWPAEGTVTLVAASLNQAPCSSPLSSTFLVLSCQLQMTDRILTASGESTEPLIKHQHHRNPKEPKNKIEIK